VGDISQFIPGLLLATLFGLVAGPLLGRLLGVGRLHGSATMISLGAILVTTLIPGGDPPLVGSQIGTCDLSRFGPGALADLLTINEVSLNVLLFVPLGVTLGLVPRSPRKILAVAAAVVLPFGIETLQLIAPLLGRYCDSLDIVSNLMGLSIGLVIGSAIWNRRHVRKPEL